MIKDPIVQSFLTFKNNVDSDDVRYKELIKQQLIDNDKLIYALNNKELQESGAEPSDYFNVNILPYYLIAPTQTNVQNFVCYEVQFDEEARYNPKFKIGQIVFHILCEQKNIIEKKSGIARHDLIAAILMDQFNWSNIFGCQIHCVSDRPNVVDTLYASRTLIFEGTFPNSIAKTKDGNTMVINNYGNNR